MPQPGEAPEPPASLLPAACPDEPPVVGEGDLDVRPLPAVPASPPEPPGASLEEADLELAWPLPKAGEPGTPAEAPPVIDRVEEIPDRFWAPEGAGLVRRAVALLVDQALLAALLGLFLAGAALALRWVGTDASALFSGSGLQAALTPLALLTALLSLAYHVSFHAVAGRTPGKRLAGLEVRCGDGAALTWGKAALGWCGGALGLACGGIGIAWALFEPRRLGWADLVSDTLIVERVPEDRTGAG